MKAIGKWRRALGLASVAMVGLGAVSFAGDGGGIGGEEIPCANERACNIPVQFHYGGKTWKCGVGIKILGVGGAIYGEICFQHETMIPAHQECHGVANEGTRCVKEDDILVKTRDCKCGGLMLPFLDTGFPLKCECGDYYYSGTIEDFMTEDC